MVDSSFITSMLESVGYIIIDLTMLLLIVGSISYGVWKWFSSKRVWRHEFLLVREPNYVENLKARVVKTRLGLKKFMVKGYESLDYLLPIRDPNVFFNGKPCRAITFDGQGGIAYLDQFVHRKEFKELDVKQREKLTEFLKTDLGLGIDFTFLKEVKLNKTAYMDNSLSSIEKAEQADAVIEAKTKHNALTASHKWVLITVIVIMVLSLVTAWLTSRGTIGIGQSMEKSSENLVRFSQEQAKASENMDRYAKTMERLLMFLSDGNYTMELDAGGLSENK